MRYCWEYLRKQKLVGGKQSIKHAEIYKQNIQGEIRYIAKMYIDREETQEESFSSPTFEETAKHVLKECVISSYVDTTEILIEK